MTVTDMLLNQDEPEIVKSLNEICWFFEVAHAKFALRMFLHKPKRPKFAPHQPLVMFGFLSVMSSVWNACHFPICGRRHHKLPISKLNPRFAQG